MLIAIDFGGICLSTEHINSLISIPLILLLFSPLVSNQILNRVGAQTSGVTPKPFLDVVGDR
jgi:hypothetical protein